MAERIERTPVRYPFSFVVAGDSGSLAGSASDMPGSDPGMAVGDAPGAVLNSHVGA